MLGLTNITRYTPPSPKTYIIKIDQNNSDPLACCTYEGDAVGMTKGSDAWDEFFGYKPCLLSTDEPHQVVYLDPNDFSRDIDGNDVSSIITSGMIDSITFVDVMIEFPRLAINIENDGNGVITVSMSTDIGVFGSDSLDSRVFGSKDKFYLGAYLANNPSNTQTLVSRSGQEPTTNIDLTNAIAYAQNRGSGYDIMGFYQWTYIQCLYLLKYGNLNSQAALGQGYTEGSAKQNTGETNTQGMCYGNTASGTDRVKMFGLEDAWGNILQWLGGLYCDDSFSLLTKTSNFTIGTTASDYDFSTSSGLSEYINGYMKQLQGTNGGGFIGKQTGGSSSTYWSDGGYVNPDERGSFASVGGSWNYSDGAGLFFCDVHYDAFYYTDSLGCRLMYL